MPEKKEQTLRQKLGYIQQKLKAHKGQFNDFGKYSYRSCEDILEAVKPLLAETGTILTITDEVLVIGEWHYLKAEVGFCAQTGTDGRFSTTAYAREPEVKKGMDASQITGTASSYARKYALNGLFCIDDTKDSDATNKGETENPKPKKNEISREAKAKLVAQESFNFNTLWADDIPEHFIFDEKKFTLAWKARYAGLTPARKKAFKWTAAGVAELAKGVNISECLVEA